MKRVSFNDYFNDNELRITLKGNKKYVELYSNDLDSDQSVRLNLSHESILEVIKLLEENDK